MIPILKISQRIGCTVHCIVWWGTYLQKVDMRPNQTDCIKNFVKKTKIKIRKAREFEYWKQFEEHNSCSSSKIIL